MVIPLDRERLADQLTDLFVTAPFRPAEYRQKPEKFKHTYESPFGNNPPEAVIFTSNSLRKALMLYWSLVSNYDLQDWPDFMGQTSFEPEELQDAESVIGYFEKYIHNGDQVVRQPFLIGYLPDGVPLYLCPTDGESKDNADPLKEARNKILDVFQMFQGKDVIFFSSDAVQDIRTVQEKIGKPLNTREYEIAVKKGWEAVEIFKSEFLIKIYSSPDQDPLHDKHLTGLVARRGDQEYTEVIELSVEVEAWLLGHVQVYLGMGGGGVFQQFLWLLEKKEKEIWLRLQNEDLTDYLQTIPKERWPFEVIFHIMGVPAWKIVSAFKHVSEQLPEREFA